MNNNLIKSTLLLLLPFSFVWGQEVPNTLTPEQKTYELSMVWKEMSYNFANMEHCQGLNMDSLYAAYIPKIQRTKDDFEHYLTMQEFVAHFHNSHTYCMMPQQLLPYLAMIRLQTECRDGRIYIRNISSQYADKVSVGDEIVRINGIPAVEWFTQNVVPLLSCTNQETLLEAAMFTPNATHPMIFQPKSYNTKLEMEVKTEKGPQKLSIGYDWHFSPSKEQEEEQSKYHWMGTESENLAGNNNHFMDLPAQDAAYLRIDDCNAATVDSFMKHFSTINQHKNFVLDLRNNLGGDGRAYSPITPYLVDKDSIMLSGMLLPRVNNSAYRAWAAARMLYGDPESMDEYTKRVYCPHLFNNAFDTIQATTVANGNPDSQRYHGKVYVLVGPRTASAAEGFVMQLVQSPNVCVVGKTTAGATGQPLVVPLPSGIICMINTFRSFDTRNRDCSNGVAPDIVMDFGNFGVEEVLKTVIK
jgi:C-terminal processing protease CtpA/Prc